MHTVNKIGRFLIDNNGVTWPNVTITAGFH